MSIEKGSMREAINSIYQTFISDEQLLRLLYYKPKSARNPDPLDKSLPNILDMDEDKKWDIIHELIVLAEKTSELEGNTLCRIYISLGRRRPVHNNYYLATQEVLISVYTHEEYEIDMRSAWISDRINRLIALENMKGTLGKLDYAGGDPYVAPARYKNVRHRYRYSDSKK